MKHLIGFQLKLFFKHERFLCFFFSRSRTISRNITAVSCVKCIPTLKIDREGLGPKEGRLKYKRKEIEEEKFY